MAQSLTHGEMSLPADWRDLFALATIEAERAWFLEHGRLTVPRAKALVAEVNALCGELRPHARLLVDGFGVPEQAIAAPIAG